MCSFLYQGLPLTQVNLPLWRIILKLMSLPLSSRSSELDNIGRLGAISDGGLKFRFTGYLCSNLPHEAPVGSRAGPLRRRCLHRGFRIKRCVLLSFRSEYLFHTFEHARLPSHRYLYERGDFPVSSGLCDLRAAPSSARPTGCIWVPLQHLNRPAAITVTFQRHDGDRRRSFDHEEIHNGSFLKHRRDT